MKLFNKMGTFLVEVLKQYNWRKVVVISSSYFVWQEAGIAFRKVHICNYIRIICRDVNKGTRTVQYAKAKAINHKAKAKAMTFKAKARAI